MRLTLAFALLAATCLVALASNEADQAAKDAVNAFRKAYASKEEGQRISAVGGLQGIAHPSVIRILASLLVCDTDGVRMAAAGAMGKLPGRRDVAPALVAALEANKGHEKVELAIVDALGGAGDPVGLGALLDFYHKEGAKREAEDRQDAAKAIEAIGKIKCKASVDALIKELKKASAGGGKSGKKGGGGGGRRGSYGAKAIVDALKALVGAQAGSDAADWQKWWSESASQYDDHLEPIHK